MRHGSGEGEHEQQHECVNDRGGRYPVATAEQ